MDFDEDNILERSIPVARNSCVIGILEIDDFECHIYKQLLNLPDNAPCILFGRYNTILNISSEAKSFGITMEDSIDMANTKCPSLLSIPYPENWGKPETSSLRFTSWRIRDAIKEYRCQRLHKITFEYASKNEFYFDLTEEVTENVRNDVQVIIHQGTILEARERHQYESIINRHKYVNPQYPEHNWEEGRLIHGAMIMQDISSFIEQRLGFHSSYGVSTNKLLAKIACSMHRPYSMTIISPPGVTRISKEIPIEKIPGLGGYLGQKIKTISGLHSMTNLTMFDLSQYSEEKLSDMFNLHPGTLANKIYNLAKGICLDKVVEKLMPEAVTVGKTNIRESGGAIQVYHFPQVNEQLLTLCGELLERLHEDNSAHKRVAAGIDCEFKYFTKGYSGHTPFSFYFPIPLPPGIGAFEVATQVMAQYSHLIMKCGVVGTLEEINLSVKSFFIRDKPTLCPPPVILF